MASQHLPSEQSATTFLSLSCNIVQELFLSFIGLYVLIILLFGPILYIIGTHFWMDPKCYQADSPFADGLEAMACASKEMDLIVAVYDVLWWTLIALWVTRSVLRCRRRMTCLFHGILPPIVRFLRFLSPLGAEGDEVCPHCQSRIRGGEENSPEGKENELRGGQDGAGISF